jgi:hypothetical protein
MKPTAETDSSTIWNEASSDGVKRYFAGRQSHGTDLWTAGASWYCDQTREELLDGLAYMHHLRDRIRSVTEVAKRMADGEISRSTGATMILGLLQGSPKGRSRKRRKE